MAAVLSPIIYIVNQFKARTTSKSKCTVRGTIRG